MGRKKHVDEIELTSEEINLPQKPSPAKLSGKHIIQFTEASYELSLREGFHWADRNNQDSKSKFNIKLIDYYIQSFKGKSILVSYNLSERNT